MAEHDRRAGAPVLVEDLGPVGGRHEAHGAHRWPHVRSRSNPADRVVRRPGYAVVQGRGPCPAGGATSRELPEHLAEVVVDGARAEEELGGDLRVRRADAASWAICASCGVRLAAVSRRRRRARSPVAASSRRARSANAARPSSRTRRERPAAARGHRHGVVGAAAIRRRRAGVGAVHGASHVRQALDGLDGRAPPRRRHRRRAASSGEQAQGQRRRVHRCPRSANSSTARAAMSPWSDRAAASIRSGNAAALKNGFSW